MFLGNKEPLVPNQDRVRKSEDVRRTVTVTVPLLGEDEKPIDLLACVVGGPNGVPHSEPVESFQSVLNVFGNLTHSTVAVCLGMYRCTPSSSDYYNPQPFHFLHLPS